MKRTVGNVLSLVFIGVMSTMVSSSCRSARATTTTAIEPKSDVVAESSGKERGEEAAINLQDGLVASATVGSCSACNGEELGRYQ
jgi:hypothetical protein